MARVCHALIARTAKEIAAATYEIIAGGSDSFHKEWPDQRRFVARRWKEFIGHARASLTKILTLPMDPAVEAHVKETIYEALVTEGAFKEVPFAPVQSLAGGAPSPSELIRFGRLN